MTSRLRLWFRSTPNVTLTISDFLTDCERDDARSFSLVRFVCTKERHKHLFASVTFPETFTSPLSLSRNYLVPRTLIKQLGISDRKVNFSFVVSLSSREHQLPTRETEEHTLFPLVSGQTSRNNFPKHFHAMEVVPRCVKFNVRKRGKEKSSFHLTEFQVTRSTLNTITRHAEKDRLLSSCELTTVPISPRKSPRERNS